ncbi:hypothetical protein GCM10017783_12990 [Deinococcus piscis]|uniref:DUF2269 domain-containing protein n=1 Tax=Deinococcus piscis TaxID=394230 RepID=A0ABQ3K5T6_9DEIO|nr:hypothetical protein [Deinococcus piscis]GHG02140.1 hypothetical protein GCM10017783_12990 [Deinococcus piscis]
MQTVQPTKRRTTLTQRARQFWLTLHYFFMLAWVAGTAGCVLLVFSGRSGSLAQAAHVFAVLLDEWLIIPGAIGALVTGVWLAWRTNWGLTHYWWILVKLALNIALMLFGTFFMHGLIQSTLMRSQQSVPGPEFAAERLQLLLSQGASLIILLTIVVISVYKPWGKRTG